MRKLTEEERMINKKLCDESDTLSEEEKEKLYLRLKDIEAEQNHGAPWTT